MTVFGTTITFILLVFFLLAAPSTAEIKSINIQSDNRPLILLERFGFTQNGYISISISNVSVKPRIPQLYDSSVIGFFLVSDATLIQLLLESKLDPGVCVLNSRLVSTILTLENTANHSSFHNSYNVTYPDDYALFFANCNFEPPVTMDIRTEMYNTGDGTTKDYLSVGITQLPLVYFICSFVYLCFLALWITVCYKNKRLVHRVHLLMVGLLFTKVLHMFSAAEDCHHVKVSGTPHGWDVVFYMFQLINGVLLFTVIVLIGARWLYLKPILQAKEKIVLMIIIPFQVLANVAFIMIHEISPVSRDQDTWNQVFMWADVICCYSILLPIIWSVRLLKEPSKTKESADRNLSLFTHFFRFVLGYLSLTRIEVYALKTLVGYKHQWVCSAIEEIANLVLYLAMFYMFRPNEKSNQYIVVNGDNEEENEKKPRWHKG